MSESAIEPISLRLFDNDPAAFADGLGASFARHGFAVVADHGLDPARLAAALDDAKAFFALSDPIKRRYHIVGGAGQRGYTPLRTETAKGAAQADLKEFWHIGRDLPPGHRFAADMPDNVWPAEISGFRETQTWLFGALEHLGEIVLGAIARYLSLDSGTLSAATAEGNSVLRLIHYPPTTGVGEGVRAGAHEDINAITLLLGAEEAGLEILERDGRWLAINPPPGAIVVNIGDMLARMTNDVLPSTTHRVVNPTAERAGVARYSTPFFLHFRPDFLIETLRSCVSPQRQDRYPTPILASDFLARRLKEIKLA